MKGNTSLPNFWKARKADFSLIGLLEMMCRKIQLNEKAREVSSSPVSKGIRKTLYPLTT
jgi:hypothetical protein